MKRQIHAVRGHEQVVVPGHDIKLGRGGIREIEFFVQTQQLIFGGRRPQMRGPRTLDMLERALRRQMGQRRGGRRPEPRLMRSCAASNIGCRWSPTSRRSAFRSSAPALTRFAKFCGYARLDGFAADLTHHLTQRRASLRATVRGRADAQRRLGQSRLHRRRRRSRDAGHSAAPSAFSARKQRRRPSAAGISAGAPPSAAPARAKC